MDVVLHLGSRRGDYFGLGVFATMRPPLTNQDDVTNASSTIRHCGHQRSTRLLLSLHRPAQMDAGGAPSALSCGKPRAGEPAANPGVVEKGAVGLFGYFGGPGVHVVDFFALGRSTSCTLPSRGQWRIGHYRRRVPRGYVETIRTGRNVIRDPDVAMTYARLKVITQDPLWTRRSLGSHRRHEPLAVRPAQRSSGTLRWPPPPDPEEM